MKQLKRQKMQQSHIIIVFKSSKQLYCRVQKVAAAMQCASLPFWQGKLHSAWCPLLKDKFTVDYHYHCSYNTHREQKIVLH